MAGGPTASGVRTLRRAQFIRRAVVLLVAAGAIAALAPIAPPSAASSSAPTASAQATGAPSEITMVDLPAGPMFLRLDEQGRFEQVSVSNQGVMAAQFGWDGPLPPPEDLLVDEQYPLWVPDQSPETIQQPYSSVLSPPTRMAYGDIGFDDPAEGPNRPRPGEQAVLSVHKRTSDGHTVLVLSGAASRGFPMFKMADLGGATVAGIGFTERRGGGSDHRIWLVTTDGVLRYYSSSLTVSETVDLGLRGRFPFGVEVLDVSSQSRHHASADSKALAGSSLAYDQPERFHNGSTWVDPPVPTLQFLLHTKRPNGNRTAFVNEMFLGRIQHSGSSTSFSRVPTSQPKGPNGNPTALSWLQSIGRFPEEDGALQGRIAYEQSIYSRSSVVAALVNNAATGTSKLWVKHQADVDGTGGGLGYYPQSPSNAGEYSICGSVAHSNPAIDIKMLGKNTYIIGCAVDGGAIQGGQHRLLRTESVAVRTKGGIPSDTHGHNMDFVGPVTREFATAVSKDFPLGRISVLVDSPCQWLQSFHYAVTGSAPRRIELVDKEKGDKTGEWSENTCHASYLEAGERRAAFVVGYTGDHKTHVTVASHATPASSDNPDWFLAWSFNRQVADSESSMIPLGATHDTVDLKNIRLKERVDRSVVPRVLLQGLPIVANSGQELGDVWTPAYTISTAEGTEQSKGTSSSVEVGMGARYGVSIFSFELEVEAKATLGSAFSAEGSKSLEVSTSSSYAGGDPTEDAVVYDAMTVDLYEGTVESSTLGRSLGNLLEIAVPRGVSTEVATLSVLRERLAAEDEGHEREDELRELRERLFGTGPTNKGGLGDALIASPGDLRTFPTWDDRGDNDPTNDRLTNPGGAGPYSGCDATDPLALPEYSSEDLRRKYPGAIKSNPFIRTDHIKGLPEGPAVILSDVYKVGTGDVTSSTSEIALTQGQAESRVSEVSFGGEFSTSAGIGVKFVGSLEYSQSFSWGFTHSLSKGVSFVARVPDIEGDLPATEEYSWRSFLCKKRIGALANAEVWVYGFAVKDYRGSGGLEPSAPIEPIAPIDGGPFVQPDGPTTFSWRQASGTIKDYTLTIRNTDGSEAVREVTVGALDTTGQDPVAVYNDRPEIVSVDVPVEPPLTPGAVYTWSVTANSLTGSHDVETTHPSSFRTLGPISGGTLDIFPAKPALGQDVELRVTGVEGPVDSYEWIVDGYDTEITESPSKVVRWDSIGERQVQVRVHGTFGAPRLLSAEVDVRPRGNGESYSLIEDETLVVGEGEGLAANDPSGGFVTVTRGLDGLVVAPNGSFTYTPPTNLCRSTTAEYRVGDGPLSTVTFSIGCVDDPPFPFGPSMITTSEDSPVRAATFIGDVDGPFQSPVLVPDEGPAHGTVVEVSRTAGQAPVVIYEYRPDPDFCGTDAFAFRPSFVGPSRTISVTVTCVDDAPRVVGEVPQQAGEERTPVSIGRATLVDDVVRDPDSSLHELEIEILTQPGSGTLTPATGGGFTYTSIGQLCGHDSFTYRVSGGGGTTDVIRVPIVIRCVEEVPTIDPSKIEPLVVDEDTPFVIGAYSLTSPPAVTDEDTPFDDLLVQLVTDPAHGTLEEWEGGAHRYTPDPEFCGSDSFTYRVTDQISHSNVATVPITVVCDDVSTPPSFIGPPALVGGTEDSPVAIARSALIEPIVDVDNEPGDLTVKLLTEPQHGTLTAADDGSLEYVPAKDFCGDDAFTYEVSDGTTATEPLDATVVVSCENDEPEAERRATLTTPEDTAATFVPDVTDVDGDPLVTTVTQPPAHGTAVVLDDGSVVYTPAPDFCGPDTFSLLVDDGNGGTVPIDVIVDVTCVDDPGTNDPPAVTGPGPILPGMEDEPSIAQRQVVIGAVTDLDTPTSELAPVIAAQPSHGEASVTEEGGLRFVPDPEYCGLDEFTYTVTDGEGSSAPITASVSVACVNDPPAVEDPEPPVISSPEDPVDPVVIPPVNPTDPDSELEDLALVIVTSPEHGTVTTPSTGSIQYVPDSGYCGPDSVTYRWSDGTDESELITQRIDILCVDDPPGFEDPGSLPTVEVPVQPGRPTTIPQAKLIEKVQDEDTARDALRPVVTVPPEHGAVEIEDDGDIRYTPTDLTRCGNDSLRYVVTDGVNQTSPIDLKLVMDCTSTTTTTTPGGSSTTTTVPSGGSSTTTTVPSGGSSTTSSTSTTAPGSVACTVADTTPAPGQSTGVNCSGLAPNSSIAVELHSDPVDLGSIPVNSAGVATGTITIPFDTARGAHEVQFTGTAANGEPFTRLVAVDVGGEQVLSGDAQATSTTAARSGTGGTGGGRTVPRTGSESGTLALLGGLFLAIGAMFVTLSTTKKRRMRHE